MSKSCSKKRALRSFVEHSDGIGPLRFNRESNTTNARVLANRKVGDEVPNRKLL